MNSFNPTHFFYKLHDQSDGDKKRFDGIDTINDLGKSYNKLFGLIMRLKMK